MVVAVIPSMLMGIGGYYQFKKMEEQRHKDQLEWQMRYTQKSVDNFLEEHMAALRLLFESYDIEQFDDQKKLQRIFAKLKRQFPSFIDLGLVNSTGFLDTYAGPYKLKGKDVSDEQWFREILVRGSLISNVFVSEQEQIPQVLMAVKSPLSDKGEFWVVRATINSEALDKIVGAMNFEPEDDTFIISKRGFLQSASRFYGNILSRHNLPVNPIAQNIIFTQWENVQNEEAIVAYTSILNKDWVLIFVQPLSQKQKYLYPVLRVMIGVLIGGFVFVFMLTWLITRNFAVQLRKAEQEKVAILQKAEHTNRLASIGQLAAGVAHEINNPLAVINEKAGLMLDLTEMSDDFPNKEKFGDLLRSIHSSVKRGRTITHRLLGFARQMYVTTDVIDINVLMREVLSFLDNEAVRRNIKINLDLMEDLPTIESDRGQLQQVFMNIINNAMDAVNSQGEIGISTWLKDGGTVGVKIRDNGCGIRQDKLKRIFEPFFTTKARDKGTGLGLSITYGIVDKLGGKISVESQVNKGTTFTIELPRSFKS
jgi:two-component system NtrC family sensor kinase